MGFYPVLYKSVYATVIFQVQSNLNQKLWCIYLGFYMIDQHKVGHKVEGNDYMIFKMSLYRKMWGKPLHSTILHSTF